MASWRALQALTPEFGTPLVGPDFAQFVAKHRPDAKVAIGHENGEDVAFFPFHPTRSGYARGIGAPFCDYQAIVSHPELKLDGQDFLTKAGISSCAFSSLMDPLGVFDTSSMTKIEAYRISCAQTAEERLETIRVSSPKFAKNLRRLTRKIEHEIGPLRLVGDDQSIDSFNVLMTLKSNQYAQSGLTDVLRPTWVKTFMRELFESRDTDFRGCLVTLYAGDKIIAGQFGVRQGDWFHPWIASTCTESLAFSPGIIFLSEAIQQCDTYGVKTIDLAEGHGHYKSQFCRTPLIVSAGVIGHNPKTAPAQGAGALAVIDRRLDQISALEPRFGGRLRALGEAIIAAPRRLHARNSHHNEA